MQNNNTLILDPPQKKTLPIKSNKPSAILMLDEHHIEHIEGLQRNFHSPQKIAQGPFIHSLQVPWERLPLLFGSVKFDPIAMKYRMWYICCRTVQGDMNIHDNPALAICESSDGYNWTRPELNIIDYIDNNGKKHKTNLIFESTEDEHYIETGNVLIFPDAPVDKRYLMIYAAWENKNQSNRYYRLAYSADGINWTRDAKIQPQHPCVADRHCLVFDKTNSTFLFYSRAHKEFKEKIQTPDPAERIVTAQTSHNLIEWSEPKIIMECDQEDLHGENIYSLCPFFRGNTLVGIYQLHNQHCSVETVKTFLAWSHDGVNWSRQRNKEFIELGKPSQWDIYNNAVSDQPMIIDDEMLFFYSGRSYRHGGYIPKCPNYEPEHFTGISIAKMKVDRFASLKPKTCKGYLTTKPLPITSYSKLYLNAQYDNGTITVDFIRNNTSLGKTEITNGSGTKIPLNIPANCLNENINLKISLNNAELFAIYHQDL